MGNTKYLLLDDWTIRPTWKSQGVFHTQVTEPIMGGVLTTSGLTEEQSRGRAEYIVNMASEIARLKALLISEKRRVLENDAVAYGSKLDNHKTQEMIEKCISIFIDEHNLK